MTPVSKCQPLIEDWKRKCCEFSTQSDDNLVPVISKVLDTLTVYIKDCAHPRVQVALKSLDSERAIYSSAENNDEPSIRTMIYGIIQSVHGVLITSLNSSEAESVLTMVEEWKAKCFELSKQSDDVLIPVVAKLFDIVVMILKNSNPSRIQLELKSLECDLSIRMTAEATDELSIRTLMYGIVQCIHGYMLDKTVSKNMIPSEERTNYDVIDSDLMGDYMELKKEEPMDDGIKAEMEEIEQHSEDRWSTVPNYTKRPIVPKKEPIQPKEETDESEIPIDDHDSSDTVEKKSRKRPSRSVSKRMNYAETCSDSDEEAELSAKKSKSDSKEKDEMDGEKSGTIKKSREYRANYAELECPQCDHRTKSVHGWYTHICELHSTTPNLCGVILRCECGNESFSSTHSLYCNISRITVVRKGDGTTKEYPVSRENHTELECPQCKYRTLSVTAWASHLYQKHSKTPTQAGLALRCECGEETGSFNHSKICNISRITIVRKEDGKERRKSRVNHTELECSKCEFRTRDASSLEVHLKDDHPRASPLFDLAEL